MRLLSLSSALVVVVAGCSPPTPHSNAIEPLVPIAHADAGRMATPTQADAAVGPPPAPPETRLVAFASADALRAWVDAREHRPHVRSRGVVAPGASPAEPQGQAPVVPVPVAPPSNPTAGAIYGSGAMAMAPPPAMHGASAGRGLSSGGAPAARSAANAPSDSITNNQVAGVDEGDIVKQHGEHLVILRRGRLFTVHLGAEALTPVETTPAYGPGRPAGAWYDEMLIDGDTVAVIGFSYASRSTEVGLFGIDAAGHLRWRDTLFVRSNDYYSSRNYASRLVGHHLVMYTPIRLSDGAGELGVPAIRRDPQGAWESVVDYTRLFRPVQPVGWSAIVHTVLDCDLGSGTFHCTAEGVVGPQSRNFYVSSTAVYLWVEAASHPSEWEAGMRENTPARSVLFRFPLGEGPVGAVRVRGTPIDQFSFDEHGDGLRVVVSSRTAGDAMWAAEGTHGDLGLARIPLARFTPDVLTMDRTAYRGLAPASEDAAAGPVHNRFVGDFLLYGAGRRRTSRFAPAPPVGTSNAVQVFNVARDVGASLAVPHAVERIEPIGHDALAVGSNGRDLAFSAVALDATPTLAGQYTLRNASQGETRSHGFFFAPSGERAGTLGLPITSGMDGSTWSQISRVSSSVVFLGVAALRFRDLGQLRSAPAPGLDDHCVASCSDWYGNTRPIFWRGRTFALLGYELVEGAFANGRVREVRRVDFLRALAGDGRPNVFDEIAQ